jgi:peptidoglycan hydrolase-like protein with peptidoglycan-binding domain
MFAKGESGPRVEHLQKLLKGAGLDPGPIDGVFGPTTEAAVRAYQQKVGLPVDGIAGPKLMGALKEARMERKAERQAARAARAARGAAAKPGEQAPVVAEPAPLETAAGGTVDPASAPGAPSSKPVTGPGASKE